MSAKLETLSQNLQEQFGDKLLSLKTALGEVTVEVAAADYLSVMHRLIA
jgi:NADH-quinone oxidoreductase subunit C